MVNLLQLRMLEGGLREHPARFPCTSNMYEILLIGNSFIKDKDADVETHLADIREGLNGFAAEVKSVSFLPMDSPFRVKADSDIFGSDEAFRAAVGRTMDHIARHWESCLKAAGIR